MLAPGGAWPVKFDPWFNLAAVAREKCVVSNCNLLTFFHSNADKKIPTRPTLAHENVRRCLEIMEMEWEEVERHTGPAFAVRYSFIQNRLELTRYFSISLFRKSVRSGYGIRICPQGVGSSRLPARYVEVEIQRLELKRLRQLIREFMEYSARERFSAQDIAS